MKVSVITITYNSANFVKFAIESVLSQSFRDFEYIISDDCSTDNTWEIIQQYKDERIKAHRNEINIGEYPNRNKTLFEAKGEYILWIDGDDILYPHGLEFMVKMLDAFPDSAMALVNEYRKDIIYPYELTPEEIYKYDFLGKSVLHYGLPYTLFKTVVLKNVGGFPTTYIAGDTFIKRLISQKHKSVLISDGLSWWRQASGQASSELRLNMKGDIENLKVSRILLESESCPLNRDEKNIAFSNLFGTFLRKVLYSYIFKMKLLSGLKIIKKACISVKHLRFVFKKQKYFFVNNASSDNPLMNDIKSHPYISEQVIVRNDS